MDVSVLIATAGRPDVLSRQLHHLAQQPIEAVEWEMVVVVNGSDDGPISVLRSFRDRLPIKILREQKPGKNRALNRGLKQVSGKLIVFTDDDTLPCERWLTKLQDTSNRWPNDEVFCGPVVPLFPGQCPEWMQDHAFPFAKAAFCWYPTISRAEGPIEETPIGSNVAVRSHLFSSFSFNENIGPSGKNYAMGSETELLRRLRDEGSRFIFVPNAGIRHIIRDEQISPSWLLERAFRLGRGDAHIPARAKSRQVFGVPRYMWKKLVIQWLKTQSLRLASEPVRVCAKMELNRFYGRILEYRQQAHPERISSFTGTRP